MIPRPAGFLSEKNIDHDSEIFTYIAELHTYLWRVVRASMPGASGNLGDFIDEAVGKVEMGSPKQPNAATLNASIGRTPTSEEYVGIICRSNEQIGQLLAEINALRNNRRFEAAKAAMTGLLADSTIVSTPEAFTKAAVQYADALLAELDRTAKKEGGAA